MNYQNVYSYNRYIWKFIFSNYCYLLYDTGGIITAETIFTKYY